MKYKWIIEVNINDRPHQSASLPGAYRTKEEAQAAIDKAIESRLAGVINEPALYRPKRREKKGWWYIDVRWVDHEEWEPSGFYPGPFETKEEALRVYQEYQDRVTGGNVSQQLQFRAVRRVK